MADVKWIKIVTNIFDDEKMLLIDALPERDGIIVCWFKLLSLAGKQNNNGVFLLNDKIPYTDEMLATIFRRPLTTVRLALDTFESFGMITRDQVISIVNWEKYQNIEGLDKIREQNRLRVAKCRENQKALKEGCNVTGNVTVTLCNGIDIDKNKKENENKNENNNNIYDGTSSLSYPQKHKYGEYKNILLTDDEFKKLSEMDKGKEAIEFLSEYRAYKGYKAKSDYLAIKKWVFDALKEKQPLQQGHTIKNGIEYNSVGQVYNPNYNRYGDD